MGEQENTQLVQQAYESFKTGNRDALLGAFSDDIEWVLPQIENVAISGKRQGREKVAEFFAGLEDIQEAKSFEPKEFVTQGDKVVARGHYVWFVKATGREFEADFVHVFTLGGGKVTHFQEYTDTAAFARAHQPA